MSIEDLERLVADDQRERDRLLPVLYEGPPRSPFAAWFARRSATMEDRERLSRDFYAACAAVTLGTFLVVYLVSIGQLAVMGAVVWVGFVVPATFTATVYICWRLDKLEPWRGQR